jgi:arginine repressor
MKTEYIERINARLSCIEEITRTDGWDTVHDLWRKLEKRGFKVNIQTVYKDLKRLGKITSDDMVKSDSVIINMLYNKIEQLNKIASSTPDNKEKIMAINAVANLLKTLDQVRNSIHEREEREFKSSKKELKHSIKFGEPEVVKEEVKTESVSVDDVVERGYDPKVEEE